MNIYICIYEYVEVSTITFHLVDAESYLWPTSSIAPCLPRSRILLRVTCTTMIPRYHFILQLFVINLSNASFCWRLNTVQGWIIALQILQVRRACMCVCVCVFVLDRNRGCVYVCGWKRSGYEKAKRERTN